MKPYATTSAGNDGALDLLEPHVLLQAPTFWSDHILTVLLVAVGIEQGIQLRHFLAAGLGKAHNMRTQSK